MISPDEIAGLHAVYRSIPPFVECMCQEVFTSEDGHAKHLELHQKLGRVEALHVRIEWDHGIFVCEHCRSIEYDALEDIETYSTRVEWPCPTITAVKEG